MLGERKEEKNNAFPFSIRVPGLGLFSFNVLNTDTVSLFNTLRGGVFRFTKQKSIKVKT